MKAERLLPWGAAASMRPRTPGVSCRGRSCPHLGVHDCATPISVWDDRAAIKGNSDVLENAFGIVAASRLLGVRH